MQSLWTQKHGLRQVTSAVSRILLWTVKNVNHVTERTSWLKTSKTYNVQAVKKYLSASDKSVNHSETKSHRVTSHSVQENLSKWSLNFSANRALTLNGLIIGEVSAVIGFILLTSARITSDFVTTTKRSFASIPKQLQTLNINSRLVGVSFGALQTERTTTSLSISKQAAKTLNILTRQQAKNMFLTLLSRHSVLSVYSWRFLPKHTTRRFLTKKRTTRELLCTSTLLLRRLRLLFFRFQKSLTSRQAMFMQCFLKNSTLIMMTPALSARDIAVRTKSVLLTA